MARKATKATAPKFPEFRTAGYIENKPERYNLQDVGISVEKGVLALTWGKGKGRGELTTPQDWISKLVAAHKALADGGVNARIDGYVLYIPDGLGFNGVAIPKDPADGWEPTTLLRAIKRCAELDLGLVIGSKFGKLKFIAESKAKVEKAEKPKEQTDAEKLLSELFG